MNKNMTIDKSKIDKLSKSNNSKKVSPKNKSKKPKRARSAGLQLQHPWTVLSYFFKSHYNIMIKRNKSNPQTLKKISNALVPPEEVKLLNKFETAKYKTHVHECMRGLSYINTVNTFEDYKRK